MTPLFTGNWVGVVSIICWILCFYFTLTFFETLRKGDESLALLMPAVFNFYVFVQMYN